jgi:GLPGLI family protein
MGDSIKKVTAWFTPVIPVASGPLKFIGLPGLVLAAEIDGGKTVFNAKSIELTPVDQAHMVKPDKGKKVTDTEYKAIVDEKMKEMGAQSGPGSGTHMMIRIQR